MTTRTAPPDLTASLVRPTAPDMEVALCLFGKVLVIPREAAETLLWELARELYPGDTMRVPIRGKDR